MATSTINLPGQCERFNFVIDTTVMPDAQQESGCFYDSAAGVVHLHMRIWTRSGTIPAATGIVATVPEKYRPADTRRLGYCMVAKDTTWVVYAEGCYIDSGGHIRMNNFVYGDKPVTLFFLNSSYPIR